MTRKNFLLFFILSIISFASLNVHTYAARVYLEAPAVASSNRQPVVVRVFLDSEQNTVSALSGVFSFPTNLFDVKLISTQNGIVSLWVAQPHVSVEKYFDGRTRVAFEGIMPGGFNGVRSPYYEGVHPGIIFTISLTPKMAGETNLLLDGIELHSLDSQGSLLHAESDTSYISIPALTGTAPETISLSPTKIESPTLTTELTRSPLVDNNAWYLIVHEDEVIHSIDHIEMAETNEYDAEHVSAFQWHSATSPYVLLYQARNKYIHTKVFYTNNTFAVNTMAPVENLSKLSYLSRILIVVILVTVLLYRYGKNFQHIFYKLFRRSR
jgi:hypothetical protein